MRMFPSILLAGLLAVTSLAAMADKININEADAAALAALNGIGQAKAEAIVDDRRANGPFRSIDDLTRVKGLGEAIVERNRDRITTGGGGEPDHRAAAD